MCHTKLDFFLENNIKTSEREFKANITIKFFVLLLLYFRWKMREFYICKRYRLYSRLYLLYVKFYSQISRKQHLGRVYNKLCYIDNCISVKESTHVCLLAYAENYDFSYILRCYSLYERIAFFVFIVYQAVDLDSLPL